MRSKWFEISLAYSIAKMNMSMCALGHAEEFKNEIAGEFLFDQEFLGYFEPNVLIANNSDKK